MRGVLCYKTTLLYKAQFMCGFSTEQNECTPLCVRENILNKGGS